MNRCLIFAYQCAFAKIFLMADYLELSHMSLIMFQKISLSVNLRKSESLQTGTFPAVRCSASLENSAQIPARMGCPGEEGDHAPFALVPRPMLPDAESR